MERIDEMACVNRFKRSPEKGDLTSNMHNNIQFIY